MMENFQKYASDLAILYVEDDQNSRESIYEVFSLLFKSVDTAFDGKDALEKFAYHDYDIVITDINMPRMNGIELIKNIKSKNPDQHIIIISAHNEANYLFEAINLGVDNFILKPISMEQIVRVFSKVASQIYVTQLTKKYYQELEEKIVVKSKELALQYQIDKLTGLKNRIALNQEFSDPLEWRVVLLLRIDNFDSINLTYGYKSGDIVLQEIATVLKNRISKEQYLYYISANKFAIISKKLSLLDMNMFAKNLQQEILAHTISFYAFSIKVSVSIALAEGEDEALKNAHITLKYLRDRGVNRLALYEEKSPIVELQHKIQKCLPKLQEAILNRYIQPYFQPIIDNKTNRIAKYEALARIVADDGSVISPVKFIEIAELSGLLPRITQIMIDKTFQTFADNSYDFSLNLSELDFYDGQLRKYLHEKLEEYGIDASRVVLEVLEGMSAIGANDALEQLLALKRDGFSIAIDDFGAQHSNFERVHEMEVDYIKIDGSFVKGMHTNQKSYSIVKTITAFAKSIGAKVIAEYVHSKEVQDVVLELGIDYSQGYYFSMPKEKV